MSSSKPPVLDGYEAAAKHIELLTGLPDTAMHFRLIHDSDRNQPARKLYGTLAELWLEFETLQGEGYGVFVVVNEGGNTDAEITCVRAVFVDADGVSLETTKWHIRPDFIVQRDETHWHAYWRVLSVEADEFRALQKRLAAQYGADPAVCNPSRVMRLAGTLHQKVAA